MSSLSPILQGDMEGLCGLYAVVNALQKVLALDRTQREQLVRHLVAATETMGLDFRRMFLDGCRFATLKRLAREAVRYCAARHWGPAPVQMDVPAVPAQRKDAYFNRLRDFFAEHPGPAGRALIGLSGRMQHWTVAKRCEGAGRNLFLQDAHLKQLRYDDCEVTGDPSDEKLALVGDEVIFLYRSTATS